MTLQFKSLKKIKILFFTNSLKSGGKERRLIELLGFLLKKGGYEILLVTNSSEVHYPSFNSLSIDHIVIEKKAKHKDPTIFFKVNKIVRDFKPDIIHCWGNMQTFYSIPSKLINNISLINSQIASAPPKMSKRSFKFWVDKINFMFSDVILSNSYAGLEAYGVKGAKCKVIYNGINFNRFIGLKSISEIRKDFQINTKYSVVMVANITPRKDFIKYSKVALEILKERKDVTFLVVGRIKDQDLHKQILEIIGNEEHFIITGLINNVEELVNACDIGMLLSKVEEHGEGIPNAVVEYMALRKPVIVNDAGGTKELVLDKENGYVVHNESDCEIKELINKLLNDEELRTTFGTNSRKRIEEEFSIEKMGDHFDKLYLETVTK